MGADTPHIIQLPKIRDPRGNLSFIQHPDQVPFDIARCYWIYDVPSGLDRDGHAYYTASELIVALSGALDVEVTDTEGETLHFHLSSPDTALFVPPMHWRSIENFATNAVVMVLSSSLYTPEDYITDYQNFLRLNENQ